MFPSLHSSGRMGKSTLIVYKRLIHLPSLKRGESYSKVIRWLHCRLDIALEMFESSDLTIVLKMFWLMEFPIIK